LHVDAVTAGRSFECETTRYNFARGSQTAALPPRRLPTGERPRLGSHKAHGFGFDAILENGRRGLSHRGWQILEKPTADCVAPDDGVAGLVFEFREHGLISLSRDASMQSFQRTGKFLCLAAAS